MNVLLTGGSSFTGMWFAEALHAAGATVVAPLMRDRESYEGVRAARVRRLAQVAEVVPDCAFGGERFQSLLQTRSFEVLCHHAAQVANYRSADFDVPGALGENTRNIAAVLRAMASRGLRAVVATGSVFEQDEGAGNVPLRAFSPYGLSKGLTWQVVRYWCAQLGLSAGKFVIANPFGPYEEPRFVAYLVGSWRNGSTAEVRTPRYLRDNIHVDLLALAYAKFVLDSAEVDGATASYVGPCGYLETQGAFAERVAAELRPRLNLPCRLSLLQQSDFGEPLARINKDVIDPVDYGWSESAAWDALATYYRTEA